MYLSKVKAFCIIYGIIFILFLIISIIGNVKDFIAFSLFYSFIFIIPIYLFGLQKILINHFDEKYYKQKDEEEFQTNLRREIERKRALAQVDNENLHYQNTLEIERFAKIAHIQLQSNQYLAEMYQKAIINNSNNNENLAKQQLLEIEQELKKQGLI